MMTRALIALAAMLITVCNVHASPQITLGTDQPPSENVSIRARNPPRYPADAVKAKHEGRVVLILLIGTQGDILERRIYTSSGWPELDQAALDASERWAGAFKPGTKNGVPVEDYTLVPVSFQLPTSAK